MKNRYCIIMAGGIGSRFWPMSRTAHPKQFIDMLGTGKTLLQQTYDRFLKICPPENIYVVTNDSYRELVYKQLPAIDKEHVLAEPIRRNTAPCIAYATYKLYQKNPKANIIVAPSDHLITKEDAFVESVNTAFDVARDIYPAGIDFDFMDFESLDRCRIQDKELNVSGEKYKVLVLPAMSAVRYSTIEKALDFYRSGGIVLAVGALPEASDRVGGKDEKLQAILGEM
ncbi:MAG: sugar phosphate nucleotidyltransferase, partial [Bacteroidota bacterium]